MMMIHDDDGDGDGDGDVFWALKVIDSSECLVQ